MIFLIYLIATIISVNIEDGINERKTLKFVVLHSTI